jgi:AsmA protein
MKKILLIVGIVFVIITVTFLVLIKLYITPERVKALVITTAETSLDRKVNIGEIKVSLFKGIGIKDFAIKEADETSDFISCEDFVLKYKLMPLLAKKVIIEELKMEAPLINVFRDAKGIYNFETIGAKKEEEIIVEKTPDAAKGLPISLLVNKISINRAQFTLKDATKKLPDIKSGADMKVTIESADGAEISAQGNLDLRFDEIRINTPPEKQIKDVTAALIFAVHVGLETGTIKIDRADLTFQEIPASLKGEVNKFNTSPELNVALSVPEVDSAKLITAVSPFVDLKGLKISGSLAADTKLNGAVDNPDALAINLNLNLKNTGITYDKLDSIINGDFNVDYQGDKLKIEKADFSIDGTEVSLTGNITEIKTSPYVNIAMSLPDANTANLQKTISPFVDMKGLNLSGNFKADLNVRGKPDNTDTIKASINISLNDIHIKYEKIDSVLSGQLKFNYQSNSLKISKADLTFDGLSASIAGNVTGIDTSPMIDLALSLPESDTARLLKTISPFVDTQGLKLSGTLMADIKVKGSTDKIETLTADGTIELGKVGIDYDDISASVDGGIQFKKDTATIKLKSSIGENTLDVNGTIQSFMKDQKANLNIYSRKLNIDDLLTLAGKEAPETGEKKAAASPAPVKEPEPMDLKFSARGEVKVDSALYQGLNMTDFLMQFNFDKNKLIISKMTAKAGKGQFDLNSTMDFSKPGYSYKLSSKLDSLHADEVVNALFPKAKDTIFGVLSFNLTLNGAGTLPQNLKKNLIADGDFNVLEGKITDTGISDGLASFLNINELKTINLKKAEGTVKIKNSIAKLDSVFDSDDLAMDPKGEIGLDESLDLAFDLKMSPAFTKKAIGSDVGNYIKSEEGWGMIPLIVKGTLSKPSYKVDVAKASKRVIKKEADKLIDKIFKKKDSESKQDGAAQTEDTGKQDDGAQEEPDPVKDLLKGLFK